MRTHETGSLRAEISGKSLVESLFYATMPTFGDQLRRTRERSGTRLEEKVGCPLCYHCRPGKDEVNYRFLALPESSVI